MSLIKKSDLIARAAVLSEVLSLFQALINTINGSLSYTNLIVFFIFCSPIFFFRFKFTLTEIIGLSIFLLFIISKILFQGFGDYFWKAFFLILTIPIYFYLSNRSSAHSIIDACRRYRIIIIIVGLSYLITWSILGQYRNASTITAFLMIYLANKNFFDGIVAFLFALAMKTQYKIWLLATIFIYPIKNRLMRSLITFNALLLAILLPLTLALLDFSWVIVFNASETASLGERLMEVTAFIELLKTKLQYNFFGWPIGQALGIEDLSERGYMHSAYLWIIGTLGGIFAFILIFIFLNQRSQSRAVFLTKIFLVLSNAMTFLLLTNPFCTMLLLSREYQKKY